MRIEVYDDSTVEKEFYGDTNEHFLYHKPKNGELLKLNLFEAHPKYIKWSYKGKEIVINSKKNMEGFCMDKNYIYTIDSISGDPNSNNIIIYNFEGKIHAKATAPFLKTPELNPIVGDKRLADIGGFRRLDRKDETSSYFIEIKGLRHILVLLYYQVSGDFYDRRGEPHELQALNIETGEFHPTWCKYYGRM